MTEPELIQYIKALVYVRGNDQKQAAKEWGISPAYLNDVLNGRRSPGQKILDAIGVKKVVTYIRIEDVDEI